MSEREAGGTSLRQQVARYTSATAAADAAAGYLRAVRGCPSSPGQGQQGGTVAHEVLRTTTVEGVATSHVRRLSTCDTCVPDVRYHAVQQRGDIVSALVTSDGEDGNPGIDLVVPFAHEAAGRLAADEEETA